MQAEIPSILEGSERYRWRWIIFLAAPTSTTSIIHKMLSQILPFLHILHILCGNICHRNYVTIMSNYQPPQSFPFYKNCPLIPCWQSAVLLRNNAAFICVISILAFSWRFIYFPLLTLIVNTLRGFFFVCGLISSREFLN